MLATAAPGTPVRGVERIPPDTACAAAGAGDQGASGQTPRVPRATRRILIAEGTAGKGGGALQALQGASGVHEGAMCRYGSGRAYGSEP